jgi:hypothetical protein
MQGILDGFGDMICLPKIHGIGDSGMAALFAEGVRWKLNTNQMLKSQTNESTIHQPFNATADSVLPAMTADPMWVYCSIKLIVY